MAILLSAAACDSSSTSQAPEEDRLQVVTTTALLADLVQNVGGDLVNVIALVPQAPTSIPSRARPPTT